MKSTAIQAAAGGDPLLPATELLGPAMERVEDQLRQTVDSTVALIPEVSRHLIGSGGKRIRPLLLLLMAEAGGAAAGRGIELAVAVELLHNATLLHDDVVDRGELRRGVPAAPRVYGNSASVLVGDFLLARALRLVVEHGDLGLLDALSRVLAAMAEGEMLQLIRSGRLALSWPDYVEIISGKTAGLFAWGCRAGASLGAGERAPVESAARFGQAFGMAFQVTDDVLDYTAPPEQSGKDLAADLRQGKATLPLLLACEQDPGLLRLVEAAGEAAPDAASCRAMVRRVLATEAIDRSRAEARRYGERARQELSAFAPGAAREALRDLVVLVIERPEA